MTDLKVSIITVCYNSEKYIEFAIQSVLNQDYKNIEYIIIDGNSKDKTLEIVKSYQNRISKIVSEKDKGIYDAMNKGIMAATGDIIGILNSDDIYLNNNVISNVVNVFNSNKTQSIFADIMYVERENTDNVIRYWKSNSYKQGAFRKGWHPAHPTFFVRKEVYDKYGIFNLEFPLAADFELMLRFLERYQISSIYLPNPLIKMRLGGATNKNIKNIINQNLECYKAFKINNIKVSPFYALYRLVPKLKQFFIKNKSV